MRISKDYQAYLERAAQEQAELEARLGLREPKRYEEWPHE